MGYESSEFQRLRYSKIVSLIKQPDLGFFYEYAISRAKTDKLRLGDDMVPGTPAAYGDPVMDALLAKMQHEVERLSQLDLYPTYSYFRIYKTGDRLPRHRDRAACEISVSICLGIEPKLPWPLFIDDDGTAREIYLSEGDALLYRGIELYHWREEFAGKRAVQVFLHYVDQHGPHREWKFDKRPSGLMTPTPYRETRDQGFELG
jgi:hypothetical protein